MLYMNKAMLIRLIEETEQLLADLGVGFRRAMLRRPPMVHGKQHKHTTHCRLAEEEFGDAFRVESMRLALARKMLFEMEQLELETERSLL
jgi:hypothetical protein